MKTIVFQPITIHDFFDADLMRAKIPWTAKGQTMRRTVVGPESSEKGMPDGIC